MERQKKIIKQFLNSDLNFIKKIVRIDNFNDYPKFYHYTVIFEDSNVPDLNINALSCSKDQAYIKTFFEAIERYSLIKFYNKKFIIGSYKELKLKNKIIDPNSFYHLPISKDFRRLNLKWLKAKNFNTDEEIFIPAQLIYFINSEPFIRFTDSQGAAAHSLLEEALLKALLELIERETFALFFYYDNKASLINNSSLKKTRLKYLIEYINRYLFDIKLLVIENRWSLPVVLAIIMDKTKPKNAPSLLSGIACDFSLQEAIKKSLYEASQGMTGLREIKLINNPLLIKKMKNQPIVKRLLWWANYDNSKKINFFLKKKINSIVNLQELNSFFLNKIKKTHEKILYLKKKTELNKVQLFWVKTFSWKKQIYALKVISPDILPLSLSEKYIYFKKNEKNLLIKPSNNWGFPHFLP